MPSPEALEFDALLRSLRDQGPQSLEQQRDGYGEWGELASEPAGVRWAPGELAGRPVLWAEPGGAPGDAVVLYLHGGGYVAGDLASYRRLTGHLAAAAGCRLASLDYRLAPETPFPGAVDDAVAAYRALVDGDVAPARIAVAGDSAGGGLALAVALCLRDRGLPQPAGVAALSPWTDLSCSVPSWVTNADTDLMLDLDGLRWSAGAYLAGRADTDPLASPLHADYRGVCPLALQTGGAEALLDDTLVVADRARAAGVDVTVDVWPGMQHVFQMCAGRMPEATEAVARLGSWLRDRLERT